MGKKNKTRDNRGLGNGDKPIPMDVALAAPPEWTGAPQVSKEAAAKLAEIDVRARIDLNAIIADTDLPMEEYRKALELEKQALELEKEADKLEGDYKDRLAPAQRAMSKADEHNSRIGVNLEYVVFDLFNKAQRSLAWHDRKAVALATGRSLDEELATLKEQITKAALKAMAGEIKEMQAELKAAKSALKEVEKTNPKKDVGEKRKQAKSLREEAALLRASLKGEVSNA